ncbi:hypothetical protein MMC30_007910 [Trapelia coarctata]|nr:hypothetical protein [Trapelia coarctata]
MAPNNESSSGEQQPHEEDNPFIAFRRYADEQMASLLHSFIGLPSAFSSPNTSSRWHPYDDEARRRARDNWYASAQNDEGKSGRRPVTGRDGSRDSVDDSKVYETPARRLYEHQAEDAEASEPPVCPYRPVQQQPRNLLHPAQCLLPWPVNYMLYSPYSPYHLERDETTRAYGSRWRNAFDELLDYEGGDTDTEGRRRYSSGPRLNPFRLQNEESPISLPDIMKRLQEWASHRSLGHDAWFQELGLRQPEHDAVEDEMTELDLFERLLNLKRSEGNNTLSPVMNISEATETTGPDAHGESSQAKEKASLGIISTLTSTERVILPDGTVHTKVMLKKRFADGREESSETVHTTQGSTQLPASKPERSDKAVEHVTAQSDDKKRSPKSERKGWFWS